MALALIACAISVKHLNEPPAYIHAWAQADNYSLALGFLHNGGDLFHPQTLILNKQQMDPDMPLTTVTACDPPLHHYCVSLLMRLLGTTAPWVFRGWTLAVSIFGMWMLYALAFLLARSKSKAFLAAAVCSTAPCFAYYSSSFIPTVPALSCALAGLFCYAMHLRGYSQRWLFAALAMLTLAMLQRTSLAVLWVAVACFHLLRLLRHETSWRRSWLPFSLGALAFAAYYLWNMHLRAGYGSLFLSSLLPVQSADQASDVLQNVHDRWAFHYFQRLQHWLVVALAVCVLVCMFVRRQRRQRNGALSLWWLLAIWLGGEVLFALAMFAQYKDHDYYFLDSFFLPIVFMIVLLLAKLPDIKGKIATSASMVVVVALATVMTWQAIEMQELRRKEGVEALQTAVAYKSANRMFKAAGVGDNVSMLALFAYPQNTPFCMMDREGFVVMWNDTTVVNHALTFPFDVVVIEDNSFRRYFDEAPVLGRLHRIAGNDTLSLCSIADSVENKTTEDFFRNKDNITY